MLRRKRAKLLLNLVNVLDAACGPDPGLGPIAERAQEEGRRAMAAAGLDWSTPEEDAARRGDHIRMRRVDGKRRGGGSTWQSLARGSGDTEELTRQAELEDVMVGRQSQAYDDLRAAEVLLEVREKQVQEARDEVAVQRREAAEHLVTMRDLRDQAVQAKKRVRETVNERRDATRAAKRAKARDARELQKLRREEQRIKQLILAEARKAARNSGGGFHGATGGFLSKPVNGYVTSPFGYRTHPIYGYYALHDGTDFGAGCRAPYSSAVAAQRSWMRP